MTAEQLEELLGRVTPPKENGKWFPKVDLDGCYANEADWELSKAAHSLARRVLAAEKLVEAIYDDASDQWWANVNKAATAYREDSK